MIPKLLSGHNRCYIDLWHCQMDRRMLFCIPSLELFPKPCFAAFRHFPVFSSTNPRCLDQLCTDGYSLTSNTQFYLDTSVPLFPRIQLFQIPPDHRNSQTSRIFFRFGPWISINAMSTRESPTTNSIGPCMMVNPSIPPYHFTAWSGSAYYLLCDLLSGYTGCMDDDDDDDDCFFMLFESLIVSNPPYTIFTFTLSKSNQVIVGSKCNFSSTKNIQKCHATFLKVLIC